ncbi:hypothetical protein CRX72_17335 [Pantoea sp. BRM17]|nr:hypothetical protein CRX72_17335 [Pantoea sp. BRM17]
MRSLLEQSVTQWYLTGRRLCHDLLSGPVSAVSPEREAILTQMATAPQQVEPHPLLFSLVISLWVSGCLWLSLHDRTPKSYVFMLAGYSAAIMGFPEVYTPWGITSTVLSRIEEITLLKTTLAAFLALWLALEINLDRPAWALTTVFVASQLYSASTISKSLFRLLGTLLGGLFIFLIFPLTVTGSFDKRR